MMLFNFYDNKDSNHYDNNAKNLLRCDSKRFGDR